MKLGLSLVLSVVFHYVEGDYEDQMWDQAPEYMQEFFDPVEKKKCKKLVGIDECIERQTSKIVPFNEQESEGDCIYQCMKNAGCETKTKFNQQCQANEGVAHVDLGTESSIFLHAPFWYNNGPPTPDGIRFFKRFFNDVEGWTCAQQCESLADSDEQDRYKFIGRGNRPHVMQQYSYCSQRCASKSINDDMNSQMSGLTTSISTSKNELIQKYEIESNALKTDLVADNEVIKTAIISNVETSLAQIETQVNNVETKIETKVNNVETKVNGVETKLMNELKVLKDLIQATLNENERLRQLLENNPSPTPDNGGGTGSNPSANPEPGNEPNPSPNPKIDDSTASIPLIIGASAGATLFASGIAFFIFRKREMNRRNSHGVVSERPFEIKS